MTSHEQKYVDDENTNVRIEEKQENDSTTNNLDCSNANNKLQDEKDQYLSERETNRSSTNNSRQTPENGNVSNTPTRTIHDGEDTNNTRDVMITVAELKNDVPTEKQKSNQLSAVKILKRVNRPSPNAEKRNNCLLAVAGVTGVEDHLEAVVGYAQEPLLPLAEACFPLTDILHDMSFYVKMALDEAPAEPPNGLTIDESASIRLYTIEWEKPHRSLYSMLNYTLKNCPRSELQPYFKYLKLFLTAVVKLPCVPSTTVWRGVTKDISAEFPRGALITWWAFSSCTTELTVLENDMYLGNAGARTLFSVEAINGRSVSAHSHFVTEDEILLLPGTHMEVQSLFSPASELHVVHLKQIIPVETLLELPFEGAPLYPPEPRKLPWYKKRRTQVELSLLIAACIAGIIVGAVIGSRRPPPPPLCFTNRTSLRADYVWSFNCGDAREDATGLYNGTVVNGASFVSPDFPGQGKALDLSRDFSQYVTLPRSLNLTLNTSFTVSAWLLLAGYSPKTILSDCNAYNPICIAYIITDTSMNIRLLNSDNGNIIQEIVTSVQGYMCYNCWIYATFSFDRKTKWAVIYFNGVRLGTTYMNLTDTTSTGTNKTKIAYIGVNAVTLAEPFYGLIDRLCITYYVKNDTEILFEATVLCRYTFNTDDINVGTGPSSIRARSQNVYRFLSTNQSSLLFNATDSYFQSSGFTLLNSNYYDYSIRFWLRLIISEPKENNSAITVFQLTSLITGLASDSYKCVVSLHIYPDNKTMGFFFPELFAIVNIDNSSIDNDTWIHVGVAYSSSSSAYLFYQNGQLIFSSSNRRYSSIIGDNPRFSLTVGGAYLNDSSPNKPDNFEKMKCFARLPIFNYTNMYGQIDTLLVDARALNKSEFAASANPSTRT